MDLDGDAIVLPSAQILLPSLQAKVITATILPHEAHIRLLAMETDALGTCIQDVAQEVGHL